uniref:Metaxin-1-like n=1 Tax=Phallusia mammillata TaxID=59560 RepID=A0A6F9DKV2_9ASCI|nr:metaxin-1-like [Phallusia mammillata]
MFHFGTIFSLFSTLFKAGLLNWCRPPFDCRCDFPLSTACFGDFSTSFFSVFLLNFSSKGNFTSVKGVFVVSLGVGSDSEDCLFSLSKSFSTTDSFSLICRLFGLVFLSLTAKTGALFCSLTSSSILGFSSVTGEMFFNWGNGGCCLFSSALLSSFWFDVDSFSTTVGLGETTCRPECFLCTEVEFVFSPSILALSKATLDTELDSSTSIFSTIADFLFATDFSSGDDGRPVLLSESFLTFLSCTNGLLGLSSSSGVTEVVVTLESSFPVLFSSGDNIGFSFLKLSLFRLFFFSNTARKFTSSLGDFSFSISGLTGVNLNGLMSLGVVTTFPDSSFSFLAGVTFSQLGLKSNFLGLSFSVL